MTAIVGKSVKEAVRWLRQGEPVALPTETVYGLAAPLNSVESIKKIFALKQRPFQNPLIVHISSLAELDALAEVPQAAIALVNAFWPGPLTLVLKKKSCIPDIVTAGQDSVAIRCPSAPLFQKVLNSIGEPLVAPSANKFQHISPTTASHVAQDMGDVLTYILDGGPCTFGLESTIVSLLDENHPCLLRPGPIEKEALEALLKVPVVQFQSPTAESESHVSPGLYKKHYSPKTPLYLVNRLESFCPPPELHAAFTENAAHVYLYPPLHAPRANTFILSPNHSLKEAAAHLFQCLQQLDAQSWSSIWIEKPPAQGLGQAMLDRLSRAAHFNLTH